MKKRTLPIILAALSVCWAIFIFSNSLIMPGITIHEGAIVLTGSVVTKDVPADTVVGGVPAKIIKKLNFDD